MVRAFNADKPYDQFVCEQIAGDELKPNDPDHVIATGFLRMGPWEHTAMSVAAVTRQQYLDDVVNSVGVTFLANELRCAKCHDHKFDPIPTKDFYRMQAVFGSISFMERKLPWQSFENITGIQADRERYLRQQKTKAIRSITTLPEADRPVKKFDQDTERIGHGKVNNKRRQQLNYQLKRSNPMAFSVANGANDRIHILKGGSIESPQAAVSPGVLSLFAGSEKGASVTTLKTGRRTELARWIASKDNPLTARVIVNRLWQWHFGQAIAGNPNNFGGTGKLPTHPELLDWLAATFVEEGWSLKKLHRRILTSATYQRAVAHPDPETLSGSTLTDELRSLYTASVDRGGIARCDVVGFGRTQSRDWRHPGASGDQRGSRHATAPHHGLGGPCLSGRSHARPAQPPHPLRRAHPHAGQSDARDF